KKQVATAARALKTQKFDFIFSSDLPRAKETAAIIAKELGIKKATFDKRLREIQLGSFSGKPSAEYGKLLPTFEERFTKQIEPDAESLRDVRTLMWRLLKELEKEYRGKNILIVSHEDPIWMLVEAALGWSEKEATEKK